MHIAQFPDQLFLSSRCAALTASGAIYVVHAHFEIRRALPLPKDSLRRTGASVTRRSRISKFAGVKVPVLRSSATRYEIQRGPLSTFCENFRDSELLHEQLCSAYIWQVIAPTPPGLDAAPPQQLLRHKLRHSRSQALSSQPVAER